MMMSGCDCDECVARKVGELINYSMMLEQAVIQIKQLLDAGNATLAYKLIQAAAIEAERRDLSGEIEGMMMAQTMQMAADARRAGRLH